VRITYTHVENWANSILFYSILEQNLVFSSVMFYFRVNSFLFCAVQLYSILFYSALCYSTLLYSVLYCFVMFYSERHVDAHAAYDVTLQPNSLLYNQESGITISISYIEPQKLL